MSSHGCSRWNRASHCQRHWEIDFAIDIIRHYAALDLPDEILKDDAKQKIVRQRMWLGVVAPIVPWNFPMLLRRELADLTTTIDRR